MHSKSQGGIPNINNSFLWSFSCPPSFPPYLIYNDEYNVKHILYSIELVEEYDKNYSICDKMSKIERVINCHIVHIFKVIILRILAKVMCISDL